jgi:hypothetical protein
MKKEAVILILIGLVGMFVAVSGLVSVSAINTGNSSISCIDSNNNSGNITHVYLDNDHDSYGAGNLIDFCLTTDNLPLGYSHVNSDCNDNDSSLFQNMTVYLDNDHDSYGTLNSTIMCLGNSIPLGYSNNSLDCNDNDSSLWQNIAGYLDRDEDFYGENNPVFFCSLNLPTMYVNQTGDCNDENPLSHPNATELCNGIDDNCDGKIDEGFNLIQVCYVGAGECRNQGITVCNKDKNGTFCKGTSKKPSVEICDGKDNDCDGLVDENDICNNTNISFIVNLPNRSTYNTNKITVNLSLISNYGKSADRISYFDYSLQKPKEIMLCKKCKGYGDTSVKTVNLKNGQHNLLFRAILNGTEYENSFSILVDSKNPRLYLPRIRAKDYTNGDFSINYDEDNLKSITLFYDNKSYTDTNCSSGKGKICNLNVDLSEYSGKDILYSYLVEDISGNKIQTKNMTAEVDVTPPLVNEISFPVIGNYVYFRLNVTEKNFKDISYFDNSYDKAKWKILCSVLKNGICEKQQRLSPGEHNITIRVSDLAGNSVLNNI